MHSLSSRLFALCSAVLTAACCLGHPTTPAPNACMRIRIDPAFEPVDKRAILLAVQQWEKALRTHLDCTTGAYVSFSRADEAMGLQLDERVGYPAGQTFAVSHQGSIRRGDTVWMMTDRMARYSVSHGEDLAWLSFETAAHEIGHVLGLPHTPEHTHGTIMSPSVTDAERTWEIPVRDAREAERALR